LHINGLLKGQMLCSECFLAESAHLLKPQFELLKHEKSPPKPFFENLVK